MTIESTRLQLVRDSKERTYILSSLQLRDALLVLLLKIRLFPLFLLLQTFNQIRPGLVLQALDPLFKEHLELLLLNTRCLTELVSNLLFLQLQRKITNI